MKYFKLGINMVMVPERPIDEEVVKLSVEQKTTRFVSMVSAIINSDTQTKLFLLPFKGSFIAIK
ncbi:hypothetical protein QNH39_26250 [Neobacillus novalis]|uniref:Uncharacterized protein n=1 Tax=Neobacillus novalis TaxID=220687 RepID=A0AA95MQG6_9BACI|nr:hypothetical protein [Neobacillus novalis]WHY86035.1 hypothetical protein QNH39_26250 [Neobacillus novalis]